MSEAIYTAYFSEGKDIESPGSLRNIAEDAGVSSQLIDQLCQDPEMGRDDILAADREVKDLGIRAVPAFILRDGQILSGAIQPEQWKRYFSSSLAD